MQWLMQKKALGSSKILTLTTVRNSNLIYWFVGKSLPTQIMFLHLIFPYATGDFRYANTIGTQVVPDN